MTLFFPVVEMASSLLNTDERWPTRVPTEAQSSPTRARGPGWPRHCPCFPVLLSSVAVGQEGLPQGGRSRPCGLRVVVYSLRTSASGKGAPLTKSQAPSPLSGLRPGLGLESRVEAGGRTWEVVPFWLSPSSGAGRPLALETQP